MMYPLKRIMIALDFSSMDKMLIRYTAFLSYYLSPQKIYFLNVQEDLDLPTPLLASFPELSTPRDEAMADRMKSEVETYFPDVSDYDVEYKIVEGSPRREILRWSHIKQTDLLILGRKKKINGSGLLPQQIARSASGSVLMVPENTPFQLKHLLVGMDFSEHAEMALEASYLFAKVDTDIKVTCEHIYSVPLGYTKTGKSEAEFAGIMESHAKERFEEFLNKYPAPVGVQPDFTYDHFGHTPAKLINHAAHEKGADMIILGARGRTATAAFFLGSVSEKLIQADADIPLLLIKEKDRQMNLMETFQTI